MSVNFQAACSAAAPRWRPVRLRRDGAERRQAEAGGAPAPDRGAESEIARYCAALAPCAARSARRLSDAPSADLEQRSARGSREARKKEAAAREWVTKRETMMKSATDDVVAIYAKMAPDAAATELSAMDEGMAAAVLAKLKPKTRERHPRAKWIPTRPASSPP